MYIDFAAATTVVDGHQDGRLVFLQDGSHPSFPSGPLNERFGYIAFEYLDEAVGDRVFRRLAPNMTFGEANELVDPFPTGFGRQRADMDVRLDLVEQHITANLARRGQRG